MQGKHAGTFRLRLGDYRVLFKPTGEVLRILHVKHRSEAYR
ncbi:type II toxin-antitoxin system RelE/ParE family toxin [uncultured Paludibaculum sp.]